MGFFDFLNLGTNRDGTAPATPPIAGGIRDAAKAFLVLQLVSWGLPEPMASELVLGLISAGFGVATTVGKLGRGLAAKLATSQGWTGRVFSWVLRLIPL
jgi:hypothetical protein